MNKRSSLVPAMFIVVAMVLLFCFVKYNSNSDQNRPPTKNSNQDNSIKLSLTKPEEVDWVKGNKNSKNILIEYSDFQCPACAFYNPIFNQLISDYSENTIFIYRHFPLREIHQNAFASAQASEAAGKQGKFWEMKDILFSKQTEWEKASDPISQFVNYASSIQLNIGQFRIDYQSPEIKNKIEKERSSGDNISIEGTPTFYLNGSKISNPRTIDEFKKIIDQELKKTQ